MTKYGFGVATEIDFDEAFRPLTILKRTFWGLLALLVASSVAIFVFTLRMARLRRQAREATIEAKQLGQYKLEEKLGAGAMGVVYKGRHAMLRRPTAIKLLDADNVTEKSIARFEREVQITSNLNHPNTIAIYDYGHTPEGVFYYAMEYLDGIDLQQLVDVYGPQPAGRVIFILSQVCGSLYEAHCSGLVHRDIKPANVMINYRGSRGDMVKVLDFGLVKARGEPARRHRRGDGRHAALHVARGDSAARLGRCVQRPVRGRRGGLLPADRAAGVRGEEPGGLVPDAHLRTPVPPSERLGKPVPAELEHAILACLEKSRAKRPQTARDLAKLLEACPASSEWTLDQADAWWASHQRGQRPAGAASPSGSLTGGNEHDATMLFE